MLCLPDEIGIRTSVDIRVLGSSFSVILSSELDE